MTSLLPTLQRHILSESPVLRRLRRRRVSASSPLASLACELLTFLTEVAAIKPVAVSSESLCTLLQAATCSKEDSYLQAATCNSGMVQKDW